MTPVAYTVPARTTLPCNGDRYRPIELAVTLGVTTPRCMWCREWIGEESGECLGYLEPERAGTP